ncbi:YdeI/OmpD-associated family protein [Aurantibacillus circumpalustris]|uniref:YdeI/OmpD-associated family protein n=1 Tax=Aurantibacillus circumpalustris TaxID=3036359 RepID=UPI00295BF0E2|nr:YdeI/OmpD-associated family protein [Aurantibacillus circumpalustris]
MKKDARIDAYITKSANFAKPILIHFRMLVHKACPLVEETVKWGFPHFDYQNGPLCGIASFKQHCAIGFWKAALMKDSKTLIGMAKTEKAMGHLGRITSLKDLPKDSVLIKYIKNAMKLNEQGIKLSPKTKQAKTKELIIPDYFTKTLGKNKKALKTFEAFSPTNKKEYVLWVTEAKTEETRNTRLATAIEWMSEGKIRNWKYVKK